VVVSLNKGYVDIPLKPDNHFDLKGLPAKIHADGFSMGSAEITLRGVLTTWNHKPAVEVSGRKDLFFYLEPAKAGGETPPPVGTPVEITGVMPAYKPGKVPPDGQPLTLRVERLQALNKS